jgi:transposase
LAVLDRPDIPLHTNGSERDIRCQVTKRKVSTVGAYLGLTPRRYQSGEVDCAGHISKCGDRLLRSYLFQAANAILTRKVTDCTLRSWGHAMVPRLSLRRTTVAVARKLAVIMHAIWKADRDFDSMGVPARV